MAAGRLRFRTGVSTRAHHLIYGLVRDHYSIPIMNSHARVILQTPSGTTLTTPILPGLAMGVNYEIRVPMDAGLTPGACKSTALKIAAPLGMLETSRYARQNWDGTEPAL